jgi:sn-glycerol 3-phosphate transport system substrate-binding protein
LKSTRLPAVGTGVRGACDRARRAVVLSFFYPIAVGGPITKIIDGYVAEFEKANPDVKVRPIYAGTYQETIAKAITAHKSGTPPVLGVLLSTDMFTLIDEEAVVPFDPFIRSDDDKKWAQSFFPAFMLNSQTGGKTWGIRSSARPSCCTGTRSCSRRPASTPRSRRRPGRSRPTSPPS